MIQAPAMELERTHLLTNSGIQVFVSCVFILGDFSFNAGQSTAEKTTVHSVLLFFRFCVYGNGMDWFGCIQKSASLYF